MIEWAQLDSNQRPADYAIGPRGFPQDRTVPSPGLGGPPSSLYTRPADGADTTPIRLLGSGLAWAFRPVAFPDFDGLRTRRSRREDPAAPHLPDRRTPGRSRAEEGDIRRDDVEIGFSALAAIKSAALTD